MPFMPVILWTDALLWLLVAAAIGYFWYCARRPHLAAPWRRVLKSRAAMVSLAVLAGYGAVGLADSIHFRIALPPAAPGAQAAYSAQVLSVLDLALGHLRRSTETTYSAPLATRLYTQEEVRQPDGRLVREYPRLRFGGAQLNSETDEGADLARRALAGLAGAVLLWGLLGTALRPLRRRWPEVPWGAGYATLGAMLALAGPVFSLSLAYHVLGTDKVGQDVLYLSLKSIRTSLIIGTLTTLVMLPFGAMLGVAAGYFKGWVDDLIQYVYTTLNSIPAVLLIAAFVLMMQVYIDGHPELFPTVAQRADVRLLLLCVILGITSWTGLARLLRGEALKLGELEFVQAAHGFGVSHLRILTRHLLPNVAHIIIISLVLDFSGLVLAEVVLSYVGVGVDPSTISFGIMINAARLEMAREPMVWWSLASAFFFLLALVLAANLLADAVRDGFDPRVRVGGAAQGAAA
jgi:peptide/nickel transport system permease protein